MHWPPPVIKSALAIGECAAPTIKKKRSRPKAHGHNKRFHEPKTSK
uniref:Uncharacterized protein n=1 Tax=Globisporangium ultimum (strain ATCC 200006 / CBS 805.95 / DAOM BR144) TaxID=431595 RepID=K3WZL6_GLOUD